MVQVPDDQPFDISVSVVDTTGAVIDSPTGVLVESSNPADVALAQDAAGHPGDERFWIGTPQVAEGSFVLQASASITDAEGNPLGATGRSEAVDIVPGAPAGVSIVISAVPPAV